MAFANVDDDLMAWPGLARRFVNNLTTGSRTVLDAAGEYHAFILQAQEDMAISHGYLKLNAVSGSPTADLRIETIDASTGLPTGTLWATNTNIVTGTLTTTGAVHAFTATANVTKGQWYAYVILYNSGTSLTTTEFSGWGGELNFARSAINTGTPTLGSLINHLIGLGSSATSFYHLPGANLPANGTSGTNVTNASGGRWGARFQVPFKCEIHGAISIGGAGPQDLTFYDDAGSAISGATASLVVGPYTSVTRNAILIGTPFTATPGTWYRGALIPTSVTNLFQRSITTPSVDYLSGFPGRGNFRRTDYTTAGGWSDANEAHAPLFDLLIRRLDDGAGGGGGGGASRAYAF